MQSLKLLSNVTSWYALNKKLEELTKSGQAKFAGSTFEGIDIFLGTSRKPRSKKS